jgi:hypothetical protein
MFFKREDEPVVKIGNGGFSKNAKNLLQRINKNG